MTHYLIVEELLGNEPVFDRWIEHEDNCPTVVRYEHPTIWELGVYEYTCGVGYWESNYGHEDLKDDPRYSIEGKYEIDFYNYTPQSSFEDPECYLYFVDGNLPSNE